MVCCLIDKDDRSADKSRCASCSLVELCLPSALAEEDLLMLDEAISKRKIMQKADEIFITNVIQGIKPVTKFRKKMYATEAAKKFQNKLNVKLRLD